MTNTFKPGDRVRRTRPHLGSHKYPAGYEFTVSKVTNNTLWEEGEGTYGHNVGNVELVAAALKVGDKVRLTGSRWRGDHIPARGDIVTIEAVENNQGVFRQNGKGWAWRTVLNDSATETGYAGDWGADLVTTDSTGYVEGTPRAEKAVPETLDVKAAYAGGDPAKLAEFNRWYERELLEANAEGQEDGFRRGHSAGWKQRGELEAADLADWERELLGLNPRPEPVVVPSCRKFVKGLPVGTRFRGTVSGAEYVRTSRGIIVTKPVNDPRWSYAELGAEYTLDAISRSANTYEVIE